MTTKKKQDKLKPAELFLQQIKVNKLHELPDYTFVSEFKFHPTRRWRFDFAWIPIKSREWGTEAVAIEVQGGVWNGGGHVTGAGYTKDCEKLNEAQILGWRVLYLTSSMIRNSDEGIDYLIRALGIDE
jgi:hypothetical protein